MQGEFRGDFTRDTYDKSKHFLRVLMQQGRVQLDADFNEQISILLDRLQTLTKDVLGLHGGPEDNCGFEFIANHEQINNLSSLSEHEKKQLKNKLNDEGYLIGKGNYYVEGLLCENEDYIPYLKQRDSASFEVLLNGYTYLAYLDIWERHITHIEDEDEMKIGIREVALGGADTTTRSKLVWQVKLKEINNPKDIETVTQQIKSNNKYFHSLLGRELLKPGNGKIRARATKLISANTNEPCIIASKSTYRGTENQLYRVEVFTVPDSEGQRKVTFVWSRENSSVVFPILTSSTNSSITSFTLEHVGRDSHLSLSEGNWVEIIDDDYVLQGRPRKLLRVATIDPIQKQVTLMGDASGTVLEMEKHPLLRRWDSGEIHIKLSNTDEKWIALEDGIEVQFVEGCYQVGDYWLIPVRNATGDVEWPKKRIENKLVPDAQTPHGVAHHYAPLAIISVGAEKVTAHDCRRSISSKENSTASQEFNSVVNASWHHDQVFEVSIPEQEEAAVSAPKDQVFQVSSQELTNLFIKSGLVVQFKKQVRVDSLHQRSVFALAQQINTSGSEVVSILPMVVEPVQIKKIEPKCISWLIGNEVLESEFNLITEVEPLKNQDFTQAVRLIVPENWSNLEVFNKNDISQVTVILRGDWILNEEVLFDNISVNWERDCHCSIVLDNLRKQLQERGISLSHNVILSQEKKNCRWRLIDQDKMYIIRLENEELTISKFHALDGNNIWPGVPERPSGKASEGGDWISVIHIKQPLKMVVPNLQ